MAAEDYGEFNPDDYGVPPETPKKGRFAPRPVLRAQMSRGMSSDMEEEAAIRAAQQMADTDEDESVVDEEMMDNIAAANIPVAGELTAEQLAALAPTDQVMVAKQNEERKYYPYRSIRVYTGRRRYGRRRRIPRRYYKAYKRQRWANKNYPADKYYKRYFLRDPDSEKAFGKSRYAATAEQRANRDAMLMYGRGLYGFGKGGLGRKLLKTGLRTAAGHFGGASGAAAANMLLGKGRYMGGRAIGLTGRGSYDVANPQDGLVAPLINSSDDIEFGKHWNKPAFRAASGGGDHGGVCISNQELVMNIYGNPADAVNKFTSFTLPVNPGLAEVFPMLSQFASNFQYYEMKQCTFHFETVLDEGVFQSSTGQVGTILTYSHMDPTRNDFQTESEFLNGGGRSTVSTKGVLAGVECDPVQMNGLDNAGMNLIRKGPIADNGKAADYDQAKFQIAVYNTPDTLEDQLLGRLWVSYTVELYEPLISSKLSRNQLVDMFYHETGLSQNSEEDNQDMTGVCPAFPLPKGTWNAYSKNNLNTLIECREGTIDANTGAVVDTAAMRITFPDWVDGVVQIQCFFKCTAGNNDAQNRTQNCSSTTTGNVQPANIHFSGDDSGGNEDCTEITTSWDGNGFCDGLVNYCAYWRISAPPSGEQNTVTILDSKKWSKSGQQGGGAFYDKQQAWIKISMVNDFETVGAQTVVDNGSANDIDVDSF